MDIRCPSCNTLYEFNEARLKPSGVNLKCSQCGHVFRVEGKKEPTTGAGKRWMVRKTADGEVIYFQGLSTLQKWIIDRKVNRLDQISRTGKTWKNLGEIGELSSFFQVAESIERLQQVQTPPPDPDLRHNPPTQDQPDPDYFDPLAPGAPALESVDSLSPFSSDHEPSSATSLDLADSPRLRPPTPLETGQRDYTAQVSYNDKDDRYPSATPYIVAVLVLLMLVIGIYLYKVKPEYLGLQPQKPVVTALDAGAADAGGALAARPDLGAQVDAALPDKPDLAAVAVKDPAADAGAAADSGGGASADVADADAGARAADAGEAVVAADAGDAAEADLPAVAVADAGVREVDAGKQEVDAGEPVKDPVVTRKDPPSEPRKGDGDKNAAAAGAGGLLRQGEEALRGNDGAAALSAFERAANANPSSAAAWRGKGWAYLKLGLPDAAIQNFQKAVSINPNYGDAIMGLARAYQAKGRTGEAIGAYRNYLSRFPDGPQSSVARAQLEKLGAAP